jgi:hypothetical protein
VVVPTVEFVAVDRDVFVHVTSVADPSVEIFREDRRVRMSSASARAAAIRKRLMWCCDLPLKARALALG